MGEFSKRIGDVGEEIVVDFLALIGWHQPVRNIDIPSIDPEKHEKNNHGVDAYFHYKSPVISRTLENILISVKYSKDKYPNAPVEKFKSHYRDLGMAIESFKKSEIRANTINSRSDFETTFDRGVIFWLNNVDDDSFDLLEKLSKLETPKDFNHDGIFLVDNKKIEFFFKAIEFAKRKYSGKEIQFTYFSTGMNNDNDTPKNGSVMPVQYLGSSILPMRVQTDTDKNTLILCSRENFEEEELIKLIGLAKNITANYQSNTIIAFPDYNRLQHEQLVDNAKLIVEEASFTKTLSVENFNSNFRN
ncbi:MAG TPA: hypothetical protein PKL37_23285 [Panacibacter sp.]|nr:hypothetical protein [Panacibacter sp.]